MKPTTVFFSGIRLSATFLLAIIFTGCVKTIGDSKSNILATSADNQAGPGDPTQPAFTTLKKVATKQLSNYRTGVVAAGAGNKTLFAGGLSFNATTGLYTAFSTVDIFDATTYVRTTANLSLARFHHAAAGAGNKIVIAGGKSANGTVSSRADIYDVSTNTWTTAELSQARSHLTAAAAGNIIMFAGGLNSAGKNTTRIDMYDVITNTWTSSNWGMLKSLPIAAATDGWIAIAGELVNSNNDEVQVYHVNPPSWTFSSPLSLVRTPDAGAGAGKKILFAGGKDLNRIDIYNTQNHSWAIKNMTESKTGMGGGNLGKYVVFAGGRCFACPGEFSNRMDIYNTETGTWGSMSLSQRMGGLAMATASGRLFVGGGSDYNTYYLNVDIYAINYNPNVCLPCQLP